ncbi:histidine triad (HIT) protein [Aerococcus urinaehominis]|uniref:Histidine triad (HIT) protein n=1 Tax=Aerococcus urinaehominis TaxID=128944 RepID=A0A0X8FLG2_9LACT|nr:HIT family protein [Aerococcus urinaehominis]AMB99493.1 histidine triad (HIT) protein [Aerococcus urinaehominis]SDM26515.1 Diadenosine tetraphosphate (Ap4A) hydrolase [Aerococcus urinaehominis]
MVAKDPNCGYCQQGELLNNFGYLVGELEHSLVILFREQSHHGRIIVAYKEHVSELVDIDAETRHAYFDEIAQVAEVMHELYQPDKINYGAYGDGGSHLHFHLVPKYEGQVEWGTPFAMNLDEKYLNEEEYEAMAEELRAKLPLK